jgi:hypothetical protein
MALTSAACAIFYRVHNFLLENFTEGGPAEGSRLPDEIAGLTLTNRPGVFFSGGSVMLLLTRGGVPVMMDRWRAAGLIVIAHFPAEGVIKHVSPPSSNLSLSLLESFVTQI